MTHFFYKGAPGLIKLAAARSKDWIGVDMDGTLAEYHGFKGPAVIGAPVPAMVKRVKAWLDKGEKVKIFTARANMPAAVTAIKAWCKEHLGRELPVTNVKDHRMRELWDDRAHRVEKNTGVKLASAAHGKSGKTSYGWAYVRLPKEVRDAMKQLRDRIDPADLGEDGKEGHPHITVMYGFTESDPEIVRKAVTGNGGGIVRMGKTSLFRNDERDVLKVSVTGRALHALHKSLDGVDNENKFKTFVPHATLAYLKPGTGDKYKNLDLADGLTFEFSDFVFEDADDNASTIDLPAAKAAQAEDQNPALGIPDMAVYGDVLNTLKPGDITDWVLQRHETVRNPKNPHYDLRLGTKDTNLFSWAVPGATLPEPGQMKRPLPQTQLHTYQYGSFAGKIPRGYGAGTVSMADKGQAIITKVTPNTLHFTLGHQKVPTRYVLIHVGGKDGRMWQLFAKPQPGKIPGVGDKPIYKQIQAVDKDDAIAQAQVVQEKIDGAHGIVDIDRKGDVGVYSVRPSVTGAPIAHTERMGVFGLRVPQLKNTAMRGELYFTDAKGKAVPFNDVSGLLNMLPSKSLQAQRDRGLKPRIALFDALTGETPGTIEDRSRRVQEALKLLPADIFHAPAEARTASEKIKLFRTIAEGKDPRTSEGVMVVMPDGSVRKIKNKAEATGELTGTYPGIGKRKGTAGGLTFRLPGVKSEGRVGTGFTDAQLADIVARIQELKGSPMRLEHMGQYGTGKLRAPSFKGFETDKAAAARPQAVQRLVFGGDTAALSRMGKVSTPAKRLAAQISAYLKGVDRSKAMKGVTRADVAEHMRHPDIQHVMSYKDAQMQIPRMLERGTGLITNVASGKTLGDAHALSKAHGLEAVQMGADINAGAADLAAAGGALVRRYVPAAAKLAPAGLGAAAAAYVPPAVAAGYAVDGVRTLAHPQETMDQAGASIKPYTLKGAPGQLLHNVAYGVSYPVSSTAAMVRESGRAGNAVQDMFSAARGSKWTQQQILERQRRLQAARTAPAPVTGSNVGTNVPTMGKASAAPAAESVRLQFRAKDGTIKASATVEIADTPALRAKGLSKRAQLAPDHGMFFDKAGTYWMKDVAFPLDIVFVDKAGTVLGKTAMAVEADPTMPTRHYPSPKSAAHAIELPRGWCKAKGIGIGDVVVPTT